MAALRSAFSTMMPTIGGGKTRTALKSIGNNEPTNAAKKQAVLCGNNNNIAVAVPTTSSSSSSTSTLMQNFMSGMPAAEKYQPTLAPTIEDVVPMQMDIDVALPAGIENIDLEDGENPIMAAEYVQDIYAYLRSLETQHALPESYMVGVQQEVNGKMRTILVDWLVEVHMRFKLLQETLFLTVDLIDRFLHKRSVARGQLQLVGITAMLIASKYEEMYPPEVRDFVYIADNAYSRAEILAMECLILRTLDFHLGQPLPLHFLRRASRACHADTRVHSLAKYFLEARMMSYKMAHIPCSAVAAASVWIARRVLEPTSVPTWTQTAAYYCDYTEAKLAPVIAALQAELQAMHQPGQGGAVRKKYASPRLMGVSELPELRNYLYSSLSQQQL